MTSLAISAFNPESSANNFTSAIGTVATMSEEARAYAMSKNTYAYLALLETNVIGTNLNTPGTGRLVLQVFGSVDGTSNLASSNLTPLTKPVFINNIDIPTKVVGISYTINYNGNLNRPNTDVIVMGSSSFPTYTSSNSPFASGSGASAYSFTDIVEFTPQGVVQLPAPPSISSIQYVEIDLQPTHGNIPPTSQPAYCAAVQIDGLTGAVVRYRP